MMSDSMNVVTWTEELQRELAQAASADAAAPIILRAVRRLGFEHFAYGLRLPVSFTRPRTFMVSSYPPDWQRRYAQADYMLIDPTVAHGLRSCQPLVWSDEVFGQTPRLWDEARGAGLRVGWCQSCLDAARFVGLFTVARSGPPIDRRELASHEPALRWLVSTVHLAIGALVRRAEVPTFCELTKRQVEILQWSADGKTCADVARILALSPDTVNYHLQGAMDRLHVSTKVALIARAVRLGLIG